MLHLLRDFQRRHTIARPFPSFWQKTLASNAPFRDRLDASARAKLDRGIQFFVDSRIWEGCGGLGLREEHQVTIAAHAIRLTLGFDEDYFDDVGTVLVYPSPYEATSRRHIGSGVVMEGHSARLGESWYHGPVILAWSDVLKNSTPSRYAHNVVLHEFAHQLDYRNGSDADGIPPIESDQQAREWIEVTQSAFGHLSKLTEHGKRTAIDEYGTTNMAEFFAVSTESFFETPEAIANDWPDLFRVMQQYYGQDPRT